MPSSTVCLFAGSGRAFAALRRSVAEETASLVCLEQRTLCEAMVMSLPGAILHRAETAPPLPLPFASMVMGRAYASLRWLPTPTFLCCVWISWCFCGPHCGKWNHEGASWHHAQMLLGQGHVLTWGSSAFGGDCSAVVHHLTEARPI